MTTVVIKNSIIYTDTAFTHLMGEENTKQQYKSCLDKLLEVGEIKTYNWFIESEFFDDYSLSFKKGKFYIPKNTIIAPNGEKVKGITFAGNATNLPEYLGTIEEAACGGWDKVVNEMSRLEIESIDVASQQAVGIPLEYLCASTFTIFAFVTESATYVVHRKMYGERNPEMYVGEFPSSQTISFGSGADADDIIECGDLFVDGEWEEYYTRHGDIRNPVEFIQQRSEIDPMTNNIVKHLCCL